jgi:hypothetical protein
VGTLANSERLLKSQYYEDRKATPFEPAAVTAGWLEGVGKLGQAEANAKKGVKVLFQGAVIVIDLAANVTRHALVDGESIRGKVVVDVLAHDRGVGVVQGKREPRARLGERGQCRREITVVFDVVENEVAADEIEAPSSSGSGWLTSTRR